MSNRGKHTTVLAASLTVVMIWPACGVGTLCVVGSLDLSASLSASTKTNSNQIRKRLLN